MWLINYYNIGIGLSWNVLGVMSTHTKIIDIFDINVMMQ